MLSKLNVSVEPFLRKSDAFDTCDYGTGKLKIQLIPI